MPEINEAALEAAPDTGTVTDTGSDAGGIAAGTDAELNDFDITADEVMAQITGGANNKVSEGGATGVDQKELDEFRAWKAKKAAPAVEETPEEIAFRLAEDEFAVDDIGELNKASVEQTFTRLLKQQEAALNTRLAKLQETIPDMLAQHVATRERAKEADLAYEDLRKGDPILGDNAKRPDGWSAERWSEYRSKHENAVIETAKRMNSMDIPAAEVVHRAWAEWKNGLKVAKDIKRSGSRVDVISPGASPNVKSAPRDNSGRFADGKAMAAETERRERLARW